MSGAERRHLLARGFNPGLNTGVVTSPRGTALVFRCGGWQYPGLKDFLIKFDSVSLREPFWR